ncbi:hypothetical protein [Brevibacillus borstelensis]|uniref:hypothetical protein n=1 Tax=Brevibacillus borstelensis TaxID=45462 RepID=UPI0030BEEDF8
MRDRHKIGLPPEEQEEYILLKTDPYLGYYGWKAGDRLKRISIWLSGNGCGVRQAYFERIDRPGLDGTAWEDHVKPLLGQIELEI